MTVLHAIILGIVQGLTEFLPISSSGHLNVFPWLFKWEMLSDGMDVALHIGTLLALVIFFFKDWVTLIKGGYNQTIKKQQSTEGKMFWYLVLATVPAGILSLILDKIADKIIGDNINTQMAIIACTLIIMGIVLYIVDKRSKSKIDYEHITLKQAVLIGISQALAAAFPGVSRSGITMTVARGLKIDRDSAAKFSIMLAMPITLAAVIFDLTEQNSFDDLKLWLDEINNSDIDDKICVKMLIGNKLDCENKEVDEETAKKFAEENKMKYLSVSAKDGVNIITMFEIMGDACVKAIKDNEKNENENKFNKTDGTIIQKHIKENPSLKLKKNVQTSNAKRCC